MQHCEKLYKSEQLPRLLKQVAEEARLLNPLRKSTEELQKFHKGIREKKRLRSGFAFWIGVLLNVPDH